MDAASLLNILRSTLLGAVFVSNAVLLDDTTQPCGQCQTKANALAAKQVHDGIVVSNECKDASLPCALCRDSESSAPVVATLVSTSECATANGSDKTCTTCTSRVASAPCADTPCSASSCQVASAQTVCSLSGNPETAHACCREEAQDSRSIHVSVTLSDEHSGISAFAHWVGQMLSKKPTIPARFAVYEVVPDLDLEQVVPCDHRQCAEGTCCETTPSEIEGKSCDQQRCTDPQAPSADEEPIVELPVAPPIPQSYQFTQNWMEVQQPSQSDLAITALNGNQVQVPTGLLVSLLVDNAQNSARLEMTRELLEERSAYMEQMVAMMEQNAQLQKQVALLEQRQQFEQALASYRSQPTTESQSVATREVEKARPSSELQAIQEDLSNIRHQIAILKSNQPVPFAPSYISTDASAGNAWTYPWRTARAQPYVPVSPTWNTEEPKPAYEPILRDECETRERSSR